MKSNIMNVLLTIPWQSASRLIPLRKWPGLAAALLALAGLAAPLVAGAATVWTGPRVTKSNADGPDQMTALVALTRGASQGLFNSQQETGFTHFLSPNDTEWANGTTANYATLSYTDWDTWAKIINGGPPFTVGKDAIVHLKTDDIYIDIKFLSWATGGSFSYERSTAAATTNVPPSVSITNPASGASFIAPATVTIQAGASDTDGSVTNVQFYDGASSLGNVTASPYNLTVGLTVGSHTLTAVASDNRGDTTTSTPVTVTATNADTTPLTMLDTNLEATVFLTGLSQPMGVVFLGTNDMLVLEKASGLVRRVIGGVIQPTPALYLPVNSNSERGLLSLALHPNFPATPQVFIRWTESSTGTNSTVALEVPLLGNRVDRYIWNGTNLVFDQNLIKLRSLQTDNVPVPGQNPGSTNNTAQGNHNGGVLKFGPDGQLYLFMGDQGRRGWLQNLPNGPFLTGPQVDDAFGGPAPDNAHLSGVILRLNTDGTAPADNPFFAAGAAIGGEVGANIQKIFSYGHRNGFGMAFDPIGGFLWETENADDAYSELNRVIPGMNGGWVQLAGPLSRVPDFKFIETTQFGSAIQQVRYPPTRVAYNSALAQARLFMLPGATYVDPEFSWRYEIGPAGTAFVVGNALGSEYNGTLWIGSSRGFSQVGANGGSLYRFKLTSDRLHVDVSADPRLADHVADNLFRTQKFEGTESETLQIGKGFGITPDIEQGPDGNLYVVSNTGNAIYRISRKP